MRYFAIPLLIFAAPAAAQEPAVAIRNATVETLAAAGRIEGATVVLRGGKIEAVGKDVKTPDDARVIDARGGTLLPGLIDPHFEVTVAAATAEAEAPRVVVGRGRRGAVPIGPAPNRGGYTRIADNFYP